MKNTFENLISSFIFEENILNNAKNLIIDTLADGNAKLRHDYVKNFFTLN